MSSDLIIWLEERECLSLRCIEREAGIPEKTLSHYVKGRRNLSEDHMLKVTPVLEKYGWRR
jgi:plasmid maintenance system antidote protein VapI